MEMFYLFVVGMCFFGENGDGIFFFYFLVYLFYVKFVIVFYVIEIGIVDNGFEERRVLYLVIGNYD